MSNETVKAKARLAALSNSLTELEIHLDPLLSQTLPETLLPLEPLQQAKLQTLLSYVTYDLIFIYLKSRGIDPKTHPVVGELDRIKQYFDKIDKAESSDTKRQDRVDKAAAGRFIKHAITQAKLGRPPGESVAEDAADPSPSSTRVPIKVTSKMLEREQYQKEMREQSEEESEGEDLKIIGDEPTSAADVKGKGKAKGDVQTPVAGTKRRRVPMDPFAASGVGEETATPSNEASTAEASTPAPSKPKKKKQKTKEDGAPQKKTKKKKTS
ncbi:hypothetical protein BDZ89DRAFT_1136249 [Hymenopellis radicata]|nr:hypothetical protein BDZ89DRAFT_1136249 [Hymenopellis radicata]